MALTTLVRLIDGVIDMQLRSLWRLGDWLLLLTPADRWQSAAVICSLHGACR